MTIPTFRTTMAMTIPTLRMTMAMTIPTLRTTMAMTIPTLRTTMAMMQIMTRITRLATMQGKVRIIMALQTLMTGKVAIINLLLLQTSTQLP